MKLYTEEQVRKAIKYAEECRDIDTSVENGIIALLTPIKLPSDEEIEEIADACHPYAEQIGGDIHVAYRAFKQGLQWLRDKIQGGNK